MIFAMYKWTISNYESLKNKKDWYKNIITKEFK